VLVMLRRLSMDGIGILPHKTLGKM
ncbi:hypothetical protein KIPB_009172, partial [Kipferlia bialata]